MRIFLALSLALSASACSGQAARSLRTTGSGTTGGGPGDGGDAGSAGDGKCQYDVDCAGLHGICVDGGCAPATEICNPADPDTGVYQCESYSDCLDALGRPLCHCHADRASDAGGFCYHALPPCASCRSSSDCGDDPLLPSQAYCLPLDGGSFCLPLDLAGCAKYPGFIIDVADAGAGGLLDVCAPSCLTCPCDNAGCRTNADCPSLDAGVCGPTHFCIPPCLRQQDCAPNEVCNVLDRYLDPGLTLSPATAQFFGAGQCGKPCDAAKDCLADQSDGGPLLSCIADPSESNGDRCRPSGCLKDAECPRFLADGGPYLPWCDVFDGDRCIANACRLGRDDCKLGLTCVADGGSGAGPSGAPATGECVKAPCYAQGGAALNCGFDQFCCGEGDAGSSSCPAGVEIGACYTPPNPPWCASCNPSDGNYGLPTCDVFAGTSYGSGAGASVCDPISMVCEPACSGDLPYSCPTGFLCEYLTRVFDCGICGTNPCKSGLFGQLGCACVDDAGTGCPGQGDLAMFAEVPSCAQCPGEGDAGCLEAADGLGFNCGCTLGTDSCPPTVIGASSFPSVCGNSLSGPGCGLLVPVACTSDGLCSVGSYCVPGAQACSSAPDGGFP